jgi:hypothetical protein
VVADGTNLGLFNSAGNLVSSLGTADSVAEGLTGTDDTASGFFTGTGRLGVNLEVVGN